MTAELKSAKRDSATEMDRKIEAYSLKILKDSKASGQADFESLLALRVNRMINLPSFTKIASSRRKSAS